MKFTLMSGMLEDALHMILPFEEFVSLAKEAGYEAVDMMAPHIDVPGKEAKEILDKYGMKLSCVDVIAGFQDCITEESYQSLLAEVKGYIDLAAEAGSPTFLIMPTVLSGSFGQDRETLYDLILRGLKDCVAYVLEKGMVPTTESLHTLEVPYCSTGDLLRVLNDVPEVTFTLDTGNSFPAQDGIMTTYSRVKDRLLNFHIKHAVAVESGGKYLCTNGKYMKLLPCDPIPQDLQELFDQLVRDGFEGYIGYEGACAADNPLDAARKVLEFFKKAEETAKTIQK